MTPEQFIAKWSEAALSERQAAHQHFLDLCELLGHPKPADADPIGASFTFEKGAAKDSGGDGWADVWKRGFFAWEYKGRHKDLQAALRQLLDYRDSLESPPLLVVCDLLRIVVHTNFTNTRRETHEIPLNKLGLPANLEILRAVFFEPERLNPTRTSEHITLEAARKITGIADRMRGRGLDPRAVARFLDRIIFCLFAEDLGLLPPDLFTRLVHSSKLDPKRFDIMVRGLFAAMAVGGFYGNDDIRWFDGDLFTDEEPLPLTRQDLIELRETTKLNWAELEPSIFGTLFERGLDPARRSQLGAHYTSRADIELLVEPVVMAPLRREWEETRQTVLTLLETGKKTRPENGNGEVTPPSTPLTKPALRKAQGEAEVILDRYLERLSHVRVLDPACGSGNFLYVTLQKLKDLELDVLSFVAERGFNTRLPMVGPWQLHGIETNPYAYELAQMTVWIGYLQWSIAHGYGSPPEPVLGGMHARFELKDSILDLSDPANPKEPEWPRVDCIVGNPPFLGGKRLRSELGDEYVEALFRHWRDRVPPEADLCCYFFERARAHLEAGGVKRAGLLATQGIRGGANREVLKRIKASGDIFFAISDREWTLDGANVHISMVAFDNGSETQRELDGSPVAEITPNLSSTFDASIARRLPENAGLSFMGDTKGGAFDLSAEQALAMLRAPNPHGRPNSDVLVPWVNGLDLTRRPRGCFIIDFGLRTEAEASLYEAPFDYIRQHVYPERAENKRESYRTHWWRHVEARPALLHAVSQVERFLCTARVAKHRLFSWYAAPTLPDSALIAFISSEDLFFGVAQSRAHEVWALRLGTQLESRPRYTPTSCFETFPFPEMTSAQRQAIAEAAAELDQLRTNWLNPPEWVEEHLLEFPGATDGPWSRYVHEPDSRGIGTVRYPMKGPRDEGCARELAGRTLTALYNQRPGWLDLAHRRLDEAVFAAYGWPVDLSNEELLNRLLDLNLSRAGE